MRLQRCLPPKPTSVSSCRSHIRVHPPRRCKSLASIILCIALLVEIDPLRIGARCMAFSSFSKGTRCHSANNRRLTEQTMRSKNDLATILWNSPADVFDSSTSPNKRQTNLHEVQTVHHSPLSLTLKELSDQLGGSGRATAIWDCLRAGIDPNLYYAKFEQNESTEEDASDGVVADAWLEANALISATESPSSNDESSIPTFTSDFPERRKGQGLGLSAWNILQDAMKIYQHNNNIFSQARTLDSIYKIENSIALLSHMKVSSDGTTKMLTKMVNDGLEVESVIIPWFDKGFSTLCVSSQVGCRQGCTFCATGRMGKLRSLTTDEILVQVYYANKVCRLSNKVNTNIGRALPPVDNIVFMGMGEPADNAEAVVRAVNTLVDRRMFGLAQSKVTISTVAPDPDALIALGKAPAALAWSVHAVEDSLRRHLVPTTKYSMEELRAGLVEALSSRSNKLRRTMLEVALMEGVNDSIGDAERLSKFAQSIMNDVPGSKIVVNLIPFNDIGHPTYRTPSMERVLEFQRTVVEYGSSNGSSVLCYVRTTRGDEESSACGQLATKKRVVG